MAPSAFEKATLTLVERASTTSDSLTGDCVTALPGKYGNVPINACNSYYNYDPSFEPAVAVAVIFGLLTITHLALGILFRKRFTWALIMGVLWETISFTMHALGSRDQQQAAFAVAWQLLFLLAPLWINAFVYMTFARVVHFYLPDRKVWVIKSQSMSKYFVWADVAAFLVQAVGGVMASPGAEPNIIKTGLNLYLAGMGIQMFFIVCFVGLMIVFHRAALQMEANGNTFNENKRSWKFLMYALYVALVAILVRIIFRICEFAGGITPKNPIPFHEAYSYSLDAFPMMIAALVLAIVHPGRFLVGPESEFPRKTRAEKKAAKREKKEAKAQKKAMKKNKGNELKVYSYDMVQPSDAELTQMPAERQYGYASQDTGVYDTGYSNRYGEDEHGSYGQPQYNGQR